MPYPSAHPSDWTLEMLAEGALPREEQPEVAQHVEGCARCAAEVDSYLAMFAALAEMPHFAPSAEFADTVMSRVTVAPQRSAALELAQRWLPATPRGWGILALALLAPAAGTVALIAWLLSHVVVTPTMLAQWGVDRLQDSAAATLAGAAAWAAGSGAWQWGQNLAASATGVPNGVLTAVLFVLALAIPLSAWSLIHLLRTPVAGATHA